jgi:hypothetical protein
VVVLSIGLESSIEAKSGLVPSTKLDFETPHWSMDFRLFWDCRPGDETPGVVCNQCIEFVLSCIWEGGEDGEGGEDEEGGEDGEGGGA